MPSCPFSEEDMERCADEWGCNCGPAALAFFLQVPLDTVRPHLPGFEAKRYTSPTMMRAALESFGQLVALRLGGEEAMFAAEAPCLVRVQFCGPWTKPGANPKWAYRHTHWICTYMVEGQAAMVFDCNGGVRGFRSWREEIVPLIAQSIPRADGGWYPTHIWRKV